MKFDETMLSGYIDGELTAEERAVVERRLAESPDDRALLSALTDVHRKLSAMPAEAFRIDPVQAVRTRISELQRTENLIGSRNADHMEDADEFKAADPNLGLGHTDHVDVARSSSQSGRLWLIGALSIAAAGLFVFLSTRAYRPAELATKMHSPDSPYPAARVDSQVRSNLDRPETRTDSSEARLDSSVPAIALTDDHGSFAEPSVMSGDEIHGDPDLPNLAQSRAAPVAPPADIPSEPLQGMLEQRSIQRAMTPEGAADSAAESLAFQFFQLRGLDSGNPVVGEGSSVQLHNLDLDRAVRFLVPEETTDDALRLIAERMGESFSQPSKFNQSENELVEKDGLGQRPVVAVRLQAESQKLADVIQALRAWTSQQVPELGSNEGGPTVRLPSGGNNTDSGQSHVGLRANESLGQSIPRTPMQVQGASSDFPFREKAAEAVRAGDVWIILVPVSRPLLAAPAGP